MQQIIDANPAEKLAEDLVALLADRECVHIAVSGGSTPRQLFRTLAERYRDTAPWGCVTLWQVDERCVPPDDAQSNWRMLQEELLSKIPAIRAHRMKAETLGGAEDYESLVRVHVASESTGGVPRLDIVLLGMGNDGHTASLFPGTDALDERKRLVVRNEVPQLGAPRVTMTFPLINAAAERWFLVAGVDKAEAYARVMLGELPASRIVEPRWYIDPVVLGP
ncbi:MAG: 6-phosphogluconolactonase [Candidatus Hydrogenedentes bacterium]|nr:6-phosphogluconolactonase [Candidatus Hydrogenedentota bacterium]